MWSKTKQLNKSANKQYKRQAINSALLGCSTQSCGKLPDSLSHRPLHITVIAANEAHESTTCFPVITWTNFNFVCSACTSFCLSCQRLSLPFKTSQYIPLLMNNLWVQATRTLNLDHNAIVCDPLRIHLELGAAHLMISKLWFGGFSHWNFPLNYFPYDWCYRSFIRSSNLICH